jgi:hypothetical protein
MSIFQILIFIEYVMIEQQKSYVDTVSFYFQCITSIKTQLAAWHISDSWFSSWGGNKFINVAV